MRFDVQNGIKLVEYNGLEGKIGIGVEPKERVSRWDCSSQIPTGSVAAAKSSGGGIWHGPPRHWRGDGISGQRSARCANC